MSAVSVPTTDWVLFFPPSSLRCRNAYALARNHSFLPASPSSSSSLPPKKTSPTPTPQKKKCSFKPPPPLAFFWGHHHWVAVAVAAAAVAVFAAANAAADVGSKTLKHWTVDGQGRKYKEGVMRAAEEECCIDDFEPLVNSFCQFCPNCTFKAWNCGK